jgi:WD40 repeat protein
VLVWRVSDGQLLQTIASAHQGLAVDDVEFSPDGQLLASSGGDLTAKLWRASDGALLHTLQVRAQAHSGVSFSPSGKMLATGATDSLILWEVPRARLILPV